MSEPSYRLMKSRVRRFQIYQALTSIYPQPQQNELAAMFNCNVSAIASDIKSLQKSFPTLLEHVPPPHYDQSIIELSNVPVDIYIRRALND